MNVDLLISRLKSQKKYWERCDGGEYQIEALDNVITILEKNNVTKLKPCPFCGGEAEIQTGNFGMLTVQSYAAAVCTKCKARGPMFSCSLDYCAADEAKKAWNNYGCAHDEMTEESNACDKKSDGLNSDLIECDEFSLPQDDEGNVSDGQD